MANTIKLKTGSGSDPSASDLIVGEIAIRTDSGKIFTKKDNGSVAEISGGGGIDDGDKGDITVSNGGDTFVIDNDAVTFPKIQNVGNYKIAGRISSGTGDLEQLSAVNVRSIINVEDGATADQTASEIVALVADQTIAPSIIDMEDSEEIRLGNDDDLKIYHSGSHSFIQDVGTGSLNLAGADVQIVNADNTAVMAQFISGNKSELRHDGNTKFETSSSGVSVTGNIAVSGTVDGVDIAARNTLFGGLTSSSGVLSNGVTATTQSAGNNTTRVATTAFVTTAVSNIVDSAPSALNTLNELAAALGDDANFSTTISNSIGTKMPLAGGEFTGNVTFSGSQTVDGRDLSVDGAKLDGIESGATADQSASDILSLLSDQNITTSGTITATGNGMTISGSSASLTLTDNGDDPDYRVQNNNGQFRIFDFTNSANRFSINSSGVVDIAGRLDANGGLGVTGNITVSGTVDGRDIATDGSKLDGIESGATADQSNSEIKTAYEANSNTNAFTDALLSKLNGIAASATNVTNTNQLTNGAGFITATLTNEQVQDIVGGMVSSNTESGITVTYQDSDGTLDFSVASQTDNNFTNADHSKLDGIEAGATADQTASEILTLIKTVDGAGSGLNADFLDGISSGSFARRDANDTLSGIITLSSSSRDCLNFSANSTDDNRGIAFNGKIAVSADYNDGYLRLNNASEFSNGVYTPLVMRADGGFQVDGVAVIEANGNIVASKVPTLNQNTTGSSGSCTGNAATATKLATARTIAGVSFDGSANISLNNNAITNGAGYITSADGGNAATLDSLDSTAFLRSNAADTASGDITFSGGAGAVTIGANSDIRLASGNWTGNSAGKIQHHSNWLYLSTGSNGIVIRGNSGASDRWYFRSNGHLEPSVDSAYDIGANATRVRNGYFDTLYGDGSILTGISAGATGGGSDEVFYENDQTVTTNYTITNGKNAMAAGPITINSGVTVTVGSGETLTIV